MRVWDHCEWSEKGEDLKMPCSSITWVKDGVE